jgi:hypothetical protein
MKCCIVFSQIFRDEQILMRLFLQKTKDRNMAGDWCLKSSFCFMETTHEPLHLVKLNFVYWKIMNIPTSFIRTIIFFDGAFESGIISKLWGYVGTSAKLPCVEFCNFVHRHIFVSHLSYYCFFKGVLNIRDTNTAAEKYSMLYWPINLFIFRIYNVV